MLGKCVFPGRCTQPQVCNATNIQAALRTGIATAVGTCVTPKPAGAACTPGQGDHELIVYGCPLSDW